MSSFVLVHGSGQNAASWSRVSDLLIARGHVVAAPDLPKHEPAFGLEDYAARIAEAITGPDTVVVAHSQSGAFLPLVPQLRDCALLVFLAAVIPEPGKSVREQFTADPGMFSPQWIATAARWFDQGQAETLAKEFLFHDCDAATTAWALRSLEPFDTRKIITQPSPFTQWPAVPVASIVATEDRTLSPDWGRRTSRRVLGVEAMAVQAGHCPHVSRPAEIAAILEQLATRHCPPR